MENHESSAASEHPAAYARAQTGSPISTPLSVKRPVDAMLSVGPVTAVGRRCWSLGKGRAQRTRGASSSTGILSWLPAIIRAGMIDEMAPAECRGLRL